MSSQLRNGAKKRSKMDTDGHSSNGSDSSLTHGVDRDDTRDVEIEKGHSGGLKTENVILGVISMIVAVLLSASATFLVKYSLMWNPRLNSLDYTLVHSSILCLVSIVQARASKVNLFEVKKEARFWLILRCVSGILSNLIFFVAVKYLPSSKALFIKNLYPILVILISFLFLGEVLNRYQAMAIVSVFAGTLIMNISKTNSASDKLDVSPAMVTYGIILCFGATFLGMLITVSLKQMNKHLHYMFSSSYLSFTSTGFSGIMFLIAPTMFNLEYLRVTDIISFGLSGTVHYVSRTFNSIAFQNAPASLISPFSYAGGLFLMVVDILVFEYVFTFTDILGMLIIVASLVGCFYFSRLNEKK